MGSLAAGLVALLAATLAASLAAGLEGLVRGFTAFEGWLGSRFDMGLQPLWHAVCLTSIAGEIQFSIGKNICQTPYTTSTLCPHNISVGHTIAIFINSTWHTTINKCQ